jgi:hypothetical protein
MWFFLLDRFWCWLLFLFDLFHRLLFRLFDRLRLRFRRQHVFGRAVNIILEV